MRRAWKTKGWASREGMADYLHLVRAKGDPERSPERGTDNMATWRRKLLKQSAIGWSEDLVRYLTGQQPMTFNRMCVELIDKTADVCHGTPIEEALWMLVEQGHVEHTIELPILFRLRRRAW